MARNPDMRQRDAASALHGFAPFRLADNSPSRRHFATHRGLLCLILVSLYAPVGKKQEKNRAVRRRPLSLLPKRENLFGSNFLQRTAVHSLYSHTCALRSVFCHVHAASKNGVDLFSPQAAKLCEAYI